jgi:putative transposase
LSKLGKIRVLEIINHALRRGYGITRIFSALLIPRSTYYDWLKWEPSDQEKRREYLKKMIQLVWLEHRKIYGYKRITKYLVGMLDTPVSGRTVLKLMRELNIQSCMVKRARKPTTIVNQTQQPNLIKHLDDQSGILTTDITYIPYGKQMWAYLSTLYDPEKRQVVSYKLSKQMTGELAIAPILSAKSYWNKPLYIHSDMDSQFTSFAFESTLKKLGIKHSYSRIGKPGDNARIESFHSLIKRELINNKDY